MNTPLERFGLTLVVNHACNLRCTYCYTGANSHSPMPWEMGTAAIERAFRSLTPQGRLDVSFFGGEPLIESTLILDWMAHARDLASRSGKRLAFNLTTNGTITTPEAWGILLAEDMEVAVSFDGHPNLHDRHRRDAHGNGTSATVVATLEQLLDFGKSFRVIAVVRPDNLADIPEGLRFLHALGVRQVDLSLDLWTKWTAADGVRLQELVGQAAGLWRQWLPEFSLNWFDAKVGQLGRLPIVEPNTRCGFGHAEIAVAPSGRLYPCERLVGEDRSGHPLCLPGNVLDGVDFLDHVPAPFERCSPCSQCALSSACDTDCRCSNFIRTGDVNRPDGLLCILNKAAARATSNVLAYESISTV